MSAAFGRFTGLDPATGMLNLPLWATGGAVLLLILCLPIFSRVILGRLTQQDVLGALARVGLVVVGASATLFFVGGASNRDIALELQALNARGLELLTRVALPGSPLACLDGGAGEMVEASCEKALFASPETIAAAVSYVSAQLALLADYADYSRRAGMEPAGLVNLRWALEADRFGLVAQVLATRDSCTPSQCPAFALLGDPSRPRANLYERPFESYVVRYAGGWPAAMTPSATSPTGASSSIGRAPRGEIFLPSSASIPPVSIMNAEPPAPAAPEPATTGSAAAGKTTRSAAAPAAKQGSTPPRKPAQAGAQARPIDLGAVRTTQPAATTQ